tara:strand:- start:270 stop:503 length:234 start_codon:yes stop_codon:yes gene_type:complete
MSVFEKNGKIIIINKNDKETNYTLSKRGWFIINQNINDNKELKELEKMSNLWINTKKLKCSYPNNIMNKLYFMEKKL